MFARMELVNISKIKNIMCRMNLNELKFYANELSIHIQNKYKMVIQKETDKKLIIDTSKPLSALVLPLF